MKILDKPFTIEEIKKKTKNGATYLTGQVSLELSDIYDGHESFLDALSMKLVGDDLLMDISYSVIGGEGSCVFFKVTGDVSEVLNLN